MLWPGVASAMLPAGAAASCHGETDTGMNGISMNASSIGPLVAGALIIAPAPE
jgi:hypothetical protein